MLVLLAGSSMLASSCTNKEVESRITDPVEVNWTKLYGGSREDDAMAVVSNSDGSLVFLGTTFSNDGDVSGNAGNNDIWLVKTDSAGTLLWQTAIGGSDSEFARDLVKTSDGGYLIAGYASSEDGDIAFSPPNGGSWVAKIDAGGNLLWKKLVLSGGGHAKCVLEASDGGYLVGIWQQGYMSHYAKLVKMDVQGNTLWETGTTGLLNVLVNAPGGGYIVAGDFDPRWQSSGAWDPPDVEVYKIGVDGVKIWEKILTGSGSEYVNSVVATADGGFLFAGGSDSNNGDAAGNHGRMDAWLVKLDASGNKLWHKNLGGTGDEAAHHMIRSGDSFFICGQTTSIDGDVAENKGKTDAWILKVDAKGDLLWQKTLGGTQGDAANGIISLPSGKFLVAGASSSNDGTVSGNHGATDAWLFQFQEK